MRALVLGVALSALVVVPALACGAASKDGLPIPKLAARIDDLLPEAKLPAADLETVTALRTLIRALAAAGREEAAREAEEQAMAVLGYRKTWLKCGPGTFVWSKRTGT